jgi:hypothetical protein
LLNQCLPEENSQQNRLATICLFILLNQIVSKGVPQIILIIAFHHTCSRKPVRENLPLQLRDPALHDHFIYVPS